MSKNLRFFFTAFTISAFWALGINISQKNVEDFFYAQISKPFENPVLVKIPPKPKKPKLEINAESAISFKINKAGREKIVFKKDPEKTLHIASLTKLMTALIVLENTPEDDYNFKNPISISKEAESQEDVPIYGNLREGETLTVEKLLDLMLIYSSNDAAFALSEVIGKEEFVEKMNQKAQALGLENTHFVNPTGLDPEDQETIPNYSSAKDLVSLSKYILKNYPLIFEISIKKGPYPTKNGVSDLHLSEGQKFIGGKTGYTEKAGGCMLVIFEDKKGSRFINIILGTESPEDRVKEMQKLINWLAL